MKKAYYFDMDGTVIDSMQCWDKNVKRVLREFGAEYPDNVLETITPMSEQEKASYFISLGAHGSAVEMTERLEKYVSYDYEHSVRMKDGVKEYIEFLSACGARLFILTASPHAFVDSYLERHALLHCFEAVWSTDDFEYGKSDVRLYRHLETLIGVPASDTVMFDDSIVALGAAHKAGIYTVGVFDSASGESESVYNTVCDEYISDFRAYGREEDCEVKKA